MFNALAFLRSFGVRGLLDPFGANCAFSSFAAFVMCATAPERASKQVPNHLNTPGHFRGYHFGAQIVIRACAAPS